MSYPSTSTNTGFSELSIKILELEQKLAREEFYSARKSDDISILRTDVEYYKKKVEEVKRCALKLQEAKHKKEMDEMRRNHCVITDRLVNAYVKDALKEARVPEHYIDVFDERHGARLRTIERKFRCDREVVDDSESRKALKRKQEVDDGEKRHEEAKKKRRAELDEQDDKRFDKLAVNLLAIEKNKEIHQQIVDISNPFTESPMPAYTELVPSDAAVEIDIHFGVDENRFPTPERTYLEAEMVEHDIRTRPRSPMRSEIEEEHVLNRAFYKPPGY